jgi:hypothetical protein
MKNLAWTLVIILTLLLTLSVAIIFFMYNEQSSKPQSLPPTILLQPTVTPTPAAKIFNLNKKYTFPINSGNSLKLGDIEFLIKDIERTKEVMVNGQKATAIGNKELIILNLELTNSQNIGVRVNARNYVRLKVNGEEKLLAPEFHSDPVDLQPQSTKELRMGFSINQTDTNILLQVGELDGPKDIINLD